MLAFALELCFADRHDVIVVRHFALGVVQHFAFKEAHRIVIADGGLEESLGIVRRGGGHDLEAGNVRQPRFPRLGVLRTELQRGTVRAAEHHRHRELTARHVQHLRRRVHDLVDRQQREVPRHEFDDRTQPCHRRPDADAGEAEFGDRGVDDAHLAELLQQSFRDFVRTLIHRDFLTHEEDAVVAVHFFAERHVERIAVGNDGHGRWALSSWFRRGCLP